MTTPQGLSSAVAAERLRIEGPNSLPRARPPSAWRQLGAELVHFFALLFWIAAALALVAGLPELGIAVIAVVLLNAAFAFEQQRRAEHAAASLRDLLPRSATVLRDGHRVEVNADELVRDDVLMLSEGDAVSADAVLEQSHGLAIDTSSLTGESVPEHPRTGESVYAGSLVVEGEGTATVNATGSSTRLAGIASLTRSAHPPHTPLRQELDRLSRVIAVIAIGVGTTFFGISLLVGTPASDGFLFAVGVTVAVVPAGLLPTVTLSLAIGAQRMAARHALVRNLEAVETLGSTTFVCTDKTGTLTQNEMAVVEVWMPQGVATLDGVGYEPTARIDCSHAAEGPLSELAAVARACSTGRVMSVDGRWVPRGDPMEAALDALAYRVDAPESGDERRRFPFDPRRRRMSVVVGDRLLVKGAPDAVLPRSAPVAGAEDALERLAGRGLRVLAIATRRLVDDHLPTSADLAERDLDLLGLVALEDPPREQAAAAIASCRRAGVRVVMVTGDHPATALAIAREVGLTIGPECFVLGADLSPDDAVLAAVVDHDGLVIARVAPEDKLRIARALQAAGHVVAMTGDGVNDAPALREAAIGIAMGRSGTDVAREAADLVLLDDDFATIVAAIEQGRSTFSNIRRFLTYHLTDNVAELAPFVVWALSGGRFPLALGVLQILALDLGTDVFPALALGAEPPAAHVLDRPPSRRHLVDRGLLLRAFGWLGSTEAVVSLGAFLATFLAAGWLPGEPFPGGTILLTASGATFTAVVVGQVANVFACRSTRLPTWRIPVWRNRLLLWAIPAEIATLLAFLFVPPLADLLDQAPPYGIGLAVALLAAPVVLAVDALQKSIVRRRLTPSP